MTGTLEEFMKDFTSQQRAQVEARAELIAEELKRRDIRLGQRSKKNWRKTQLIASHFPGLLQGLGECPECGGMGTRAI
jgi:hypothetical protein